MSAIVTNNVQIGQSGTSTNNFTLYQPLVADGTVRLANGNSGSTTDLLTVTSTGNVGIGTASPAYKLDVNGFAMIDTRSQSLNPTLAFKHDNFAAGVRNYVQYSRSDETFIVGVAGADRFRIDAAGRVTTPYQTAFSAYGTQTSLPSNSTAVPNVVDVNNGSAYSTATGRFTAPVAGIYYFIGTLDINGATQGNYYGFQFKVNGLSKGQGIWISPYTTNDNSVTQAIVLSLAANDYVTMHTVYQNTPNITYPNFAGFLIG